MLDGASAEEVRVVSDLAEAVVSQVYAMQHERRAKVETVAWDDRTDRLVLRTFDDAGALERPLLVDARTLRADHSKRQRELRDLPPPSDGDALRVAKVKAVGKLAVAIDWSDGLGNDVYTFKLLRSLAAAAAPDA